MQKDIFILDIRNTDLSQEENDFLLQPIYSLVREVQDQLNLGLYKLSIQNIISYEISEDNEKYIISPLFTPKCLDSYQERRLLHLKVSQNIMDIDNQFNVQREWVRTLAFFPLVFCYHMNTETFKAIVAKYEKMHQGSGTVVTKDAIFNKLWLGFIDLLNDVVDASENGGVLELDEKSKGFLTLYRGLVNDVASNYLFKRYLDPLVVNEKEFPRPKSPTEFYDLLDELTFVDVFKDANIEMLDAEEREALTPQELQSYQYIQKIDAFPDTTTKAKLLGFIRNLYLIDKEQAKVYAQGYIEMHTRKNPSDENQTKPSRVLKVQSSTSAQKKKVKEPTEWNKSVLLSEEEIAKSQHVNYKVEKTFSQELRGRGTIRHKTSAQLQEEAELQLLKLFSNKLYRALQRSTSGTSEYKGELKTRLDTQLLTYSSFIEKYYNFIFGSLINLESLGITDNIVQLIVISLAKNPQGLSKDEIARTVRDALVAYQGSDSNMSFANEKELLLFDVSVRTGFSLLDNLTNFKEHRGTVEKQNNYTHEVILERDEVEGVYRLSASIQEMIIIKAFISTYSILRGKVRVTDAGRAVLAAARRKEELSVEKKNELIAKQEEEAGRKKDLQGKQKILRDGFYGQPDVEAMEEKLIAYNLLDGNLSSGLKLRKITAKQGGFSRKGSILLESSKVSQDVAMTTILNYKGTKEKKDSEPSYPRVGLINFANQANITRLINRVSELIKEKGQARYEDIIATPVWVDSSNPGVTQVFVNNISTILELVSNPRIPECMCLTKVIESDDSKAVQKNNGRKSIYSTYEITKDYSDEEIKVIVSNLRAKINRAEKNKLYRKMIDHGNVYKIFEVLNSNQYIQYGAPFGNINTDIHPSDLKLLLFVLAAAGYIRIATNPIAQNNLESFEDSTFALQTKAREFMEKCQTNLSKYLAYSSDISLVGDTDISPYDLDMTKGMTQSSLNIEKIKGMQLSTRDRDILDKITNKLNLAKRDEFRRLMTDREIAKQVNERLREYAYAELKDEESESFKQLETYRKALDPENHEADEHAKRMLRETNFLVGKLIKSYKDDEDFIKALSNLVVNEEIDKLMVGAQTELNETILKQFYEKKAISIQTGEVYTEIVDKIFHSTEGIEDSSVFGSLIDQLTVDTIFTGIISAKKAFEYENANSDGGVVYLLNQLGLTPEIAYESFKDNNTDWFRFAVVSDSIAKTSESLFKTNMDSETSSWYKEAKEVLEHEEQGVMTDLDKQKKNSLVASNVINQENEIEMSLKNPHISDMAKKMVTINKIVNPAYQIDVLRYCTNIVMDNEDTEEAKRIVDFLISKTGQTKEFIESYCRRSLLDTCCRFLGVTLETLVFGLVANGLVKHKATKFKADFGLNLLDIQLQMKKLSPEFRKTMRESINKEVKSQKEKLAELQNVADVLKLKEERNKIYATAEKSRSRVDEINKAIDEAQVKIVLIRAGGRAITNLIAEDLKLDSMQAEAYVRENFLFEKQSVTKWAEMCKTKQTEYDDCVTEIKTLELLLKSANRVGIDSPDFGMNSSSTTDSGPGISRKTISKYKSMGLQGIKDLLSEKKSELDALERDLKSLQDMLDKAEKKVAKHIDPIINEIKSLEAEKEKELEKINAPMPPELAEAVKKLDAEILAKFESMQSYQLAVASREVGEDSSFGLSFKSKDAILYVLLALQHTGYIGTVNSAIGDLGKTNMYFKVTAEGLSAWEGVGNRNKIISSIIKATRDQKRTLVKVADQIAEVLNGEKYARLISIQQRKDFKKRIKELIDNDTLPELKTKRKASKKVKENTIVSAITAPSDTTTITTSTNKTSTNKTSTNKTSTNKTTSSNNSKIQPQQSTQFTSQDTTSAPKKPGSSVLVKARRKF